MIVQGLDLVPLPTPLPLPLPLPFSAMSRKLSSTAGGGTGGGSRGGGSRGRDGGDSLGPGLELALAPNPNELLQLPGITEEMVQRLRQKHRVTGLRDLVLMSKGRYRCGCG